MEAQYWETTDVIICGCGPAWAMLSGYLGQKSVPNVVLEREVGLQYRDAKGMERKLRARFFVGADGKVHAQALPGAERLRTTDRMIREFYEETWVTLNWRITLPTPESHPDFPLWKLGYTPEEVYDLCFPYEFRFLCNPNRPSVCGRFGLQSDRLWRFEFVVHPGEDGYEMAKPELIKKIVFLYVSHQGSQYNCDAWAADRFSAEMPLTYSLLLEDRGLRLVFAMQLLSHMLCRYHSTTPEKHQKVLAAWYQERKQQLEKSLATTIENGKFVCEAQAAKIFVRDWYLWLVQLIPSWKRDLELGPTKGRADPIRTLRGNAFHSGAEGSLSLSQVFCKDMNGKVYFTDDVIFRPKQNGLFRLFVYPRSDEELDSAQAVVRMATKSSQGEFTVDKVPYIVENLTKGQIKVNENLFQIASAEDFARSPLCTGRPEPNYYEPFFIRTEVDAKYIIVRPDRFVFATCDDEQSLKTAVGHMLDLLHC
ncbi:hypothetical protein BBP40_004150 [Aspergillus hancockii]|nr:hypothetical protein BBP40_004150 [Aspergillus hancockii]